MTRRFLITDRIRLESCRKFAFVRARETSWWSWYRHAKTYWKKAHVIQLKSLAVKVFFLARLNHNFELRTPGVVDCGWGSYICQHIFCNQRLTLSTLVVKCLLTPNSSSIKAERIKNWLIKIRLIKINQWNVYEIF